MFAVDFNRIVCHKDIAIQNNFILLLIIGGTVASQRYCAVEEHHITGNHTIAPRIALATFDGIGMLENNFLFFSP